MSNTTPTPSRDAAEGSHFTVEDAGSTTDASDLFQNDTTAGSTSNDSSRSEGNADAVADAGAASGPGSQADPTAASSGSASVAAGSGGGSATAAHAVSTDSSASSPSSTSSSPSTTSSSSTTADTSSTDEQPHGLAALAGDDSIAHVFDQTNGVIEGIDGDSDGTADSDIRSSAERGDEDPAFDSFADTEVQNADGADDPRRTGA